LSATTAAPLRVVFAGTPEFARLALERLHVRGHTIRLVLTQPDRPAGRGMQLQASAVKHYALEHNLPLAQPRSLRLDGKFPEDAQAARAALEAAQADVMVVAAYGLILPQWVLDSAAARWGCLNIHGSLLPRWRGAAPIHRAIEAGDAETGVTIMQMDAGLDTGDMLLVRALPITDNDTSASLHDKVAALGAELICQALDGLQQDALRACRQPTAGVTYAHKLSKEEALLDWRQDAVSLCRRVRAFDPFPAAVARLRGEAIKVWRAQVAPPPDAADAEVAANSVPGTIVAVAAGGITVATGAGYLQLLELQRAGGRRLGVAEFLRGYSLQSGMQFEVGATDAVKTPV